MCPATEIFKNNLEEMFKEVNYLLEQTSYIEKKKLIWWKRCSYKSFFG